MYFQINKISGIDDDNNIFLLDIYFIDKCNFKCDYCYNIFPRTNIKLDIKKLIKWIIQFKQVFNLKKIIISLLGGEPTLHEEYLFFIEEMSKINGIYVNVYSNFSNDISLYEKTLQHKNVDLKITWHGEFNPDIFYSKVISLQHLMNISVKIMFEMHNEMKSIELVNKLINIPIKKIEFSTINKNGKNIKYNKQFYDKFTYTLNKISNPELINISLSSGKKIIVNDNFFQDSINENTNFKKWICNAGKTYLYIDVNGNIIPCLEGNNNIIGSIYEKNIRLKLKKTLCKSNVCSCLYYLTKEKIFK